MQSGSQAAFFIRNQDGNDSGDKKQEDHNTKRFSFFRNQTIDLPGGMNDQKYCCDLIPDGNFQKTCEVEIMNAIVKKQKDQSGRDETCTEDKVCFCQ